MQFNKTIILLLLSGSLVLGGCRKNTDNSTGGTFTLKSATYKLGYANWIRGFFVGYTDRNIPTGSLSISFYDNIPAASSTYNISNSYIPTTGCAYLMFTDTSTKRQYISLPSSSYTVNVTLTADGKTNIDIPAVMMYNTANPSDSALLTGSLKQTP